MSDRKFKIGIIGSGNIGGTLGRHFARAGHEVMFSSRHPEQLRDLVANAGDLAQAGTVGEAAQFGEVILLSIPFGKTPELKENTGDLHGKVLIDTNNYYPGRDGDQPGREMAELGLLETEWTASHFNTDSVVKAFNTIYYVTLGKRAFAGENKMAIPFAASNETARATIEGLLDDTGFDAVFIGDLSGTRIMQPDEKLYTRELSAEELLKLL